MSASDVLAGGQNLAELGVDTTESACENASRDFGGIARGKATGVITPRTAQQVQAVVRAARESGAKLTPRGQGMSQSGQAVPKNGLSLDLRGLAAIAEPNLARRTIAVEPGATWRELVQRLAPFSLLPPVMPLNLDLSVGGTLSAGGFGSSSFRHGVAASNVARLVVVKGTGDIVVSSRDEAPEVFAATLGGLGRVGVIVQAELELLPARPRTRTTYLLYESVETLLEDMLTLSARPEIHHLEGFCASSVQGLALAASGRREPFLHWQYGLHVSSEVEVGSAPRTVELLSGLTSPRVLKVEEDDTFAFASRYDARFSMMQRTGAWHQLHPWFECLLPLAAAAELITHAVSRMPFFLGDGQRIFLLPSAGHPSAMAFPAGEPVVGFAVLPTGVPDALREPALGALHALHDMCLSAGGKRYVSGWLFDVGEADLRRHYETQYEALVRAKTTLDPDGVFESLLLAPHPPG
jgi:cytokinin dehydrogenase